jgi:AcrR family transcriptional regulator
VIERGASSSPIPARSGRPPSSRGQKKEEEIVAAAARIFHDKGYAAASIRDIADAVGLLKGSLYYYVRSKEDLLYKIIDAVHAGALENLRQAAESEGSARDRLLAFIRGHIRNFGDNLIMIRVFYVDFTHLSPDRHKIILGERDRYEHFLTDLIACGQKEGDFAADLNPRVAAIAILTMINSIYVWYRPDGPLAMSDIEVEYVRLILRGLTGAVHAPAGDPAERGRGKEAGGVGSTSRAKGGRAAAAGAAAGAARKAAAGRATGPTGEKVEATGRAQGAGTAKRASRGIVVD